MCQGLKYLDCRGESRIPRRRGAICPGASTYDLAKFCEKLHEIEKILGRRSATGFDAKSEGFCAVYWEQVPLKLPFLGFLVFTILL